MTERRADGRRQVNIKSNKQRMGNEQEKHECGARRACKSWSFQSIKERITQLVCASPFFLESSAHQRSLRQD